MALVDGGDGNYYGLDTANNFFRMSQNYTVKTLYTFQNGELPYELVRGQDGYFYGLTDNYNPTVDNGIFFKIDSQGDETTLDVFTGNYQGFYSPLTPGPGGCFYTTCLGAASSSVLRLSPSGQVTTLYSFSSPFTYGGSPDGPLALGADGWLYGTASTGGTQQDGVLYRTFQVLQNFNTYLGDGPQGLVFGGDGRLYGGCTGGGVGVSNSNLNVGGTVFAYFIGGPTTVHYVGSAGGGYDPTFGAQLIVSQTGTVYGLYQDGGAYNKGTLFELSTAGPTVTDLSPSSASAGTAFTLRVHGKRFQPSTAISWNGTAIPTTFVSSTELEAKIETSLNPPLYAEYGFFASPDPYPGSAAVGLVDPNGATTEYQTLTITEAPPVLSSVSPASTPSGSAQTAVQIVGSGFDANSVLSWNGSPLASYFVNDSFDIVAIIPASDLVSPGTGALTVTDPNTGITSNSLSFKITAN